MIAPQMAARTAERNELQSRLRPTTEREARVRGTGRGRGQLLRRNRPDACESAPGELLDIYRSKQLTPIYLPGSNTVKAQVTAGACGNVRVRGDLHR